MARNSIIEPANLSFRQPRRGGFPKSPGLHLIASPFGLQFCPAQIALRASLDTVVMMSFRPGGTDHELTGQAAGGEGGLDTQWNGVAEHEAVVKERVAVCEHFWSRHM